MSKKERIKREIFRQRKWVAPEKLATLSKEVTDQLIEAKPVIKEKTIVRL